MVKHRLTMLQALGSMPSLAFHQHKEGENMLKPPFPSSLSQTSAKNHTRRHMIIRPRDPIF